MGLVESIIKIVKDGDVEPKRCVRFKRLVKKRSFAQIKTVKIKKPKI